MPKVTLSLITINILCYALSHLFPPQLQKFLLLNLQAPSFPGVITHIFFHASIPHLLSNMVVLYVLGRVAEERLYPRQYLMGYLVSGIVAGFCQTLAHHHFTPGAEGYSLGASGAIVAIGGLVLVLAPSTVRLYSPSIDLYPYRHEPLPGHPFMDGAKFRNWMFAGRYAEGPIRFQIAFLVWTAGLLLADIASASQLDRTTYSLLHIGVYAHLGGWASGILWASVIRFSHNGRGEYIKTMGVLQFLNGRYWDATESLGSAEAFFPADPDIARWKARCYQVTGQSKLCFDYFDKAIGLYKQAGNLHQTETTERERKHGTWIKAADAPIFHR